METPNDVPLTRPRVVTPEYLSLLGRNDRLGRLARRRHDLLRRGRALHERQPDHEAGPGLVAGRRQLDRAVV